MLIRNFFVFSLIVLLSASVWADTRLDYVADITIVSTGQTIEGAVEAAFDGTGLDGAGLLHSAWWEDKWMGAMDGVGGYSVAGRAGCASGLNWLEVQFNEVEPVSEMWVWNMNDNWTGNGSAYALRGMKTVVIEYSTTGGSSSSEWTRLGGGATTHELAKSPGTDNYAHNTEVNFGGVSAKYVVITGLANWGDVEWIGMSELAFFASDIAVELPVIAPPQNTLAMEKTDYSEGLAILAGTPIVSWTLTQPSSAPAGFVFDTNTGIVTWKPEIGANDVNVTVYATNSMGDSNNASWAITVSERYIVDSDIIANSSTSLYGTSARDTINGSGLIGDLHNNDYTKMWVGSIGSEPNSYNSGTVAGENWLSYEFDHIYELGKLWIWNYNEYYASDDATECGLKNVTVQYSTTGGFDSSEWTTLGGGTIQLAKSPTPASGALAHTDEVDFGSAMAKYVVITPDFGVGNGWWGPLSWYVGLSEVRFYYVATLAHDPLPADRDKGVAPDVLLSWDSGDLAASHDVYVGTDSTELTNATRSSHTNVELGQAQSEPNYSPTIALGRTYYWRVDEVNSSDEPQWKGPAWSFSVTPITAWQQRPADNKSGTGLLSWLSGYYAESHDVYFGTSFSDVNSAARLAGDGDGNGSVDTKDVRIVSNNWLTDPAGSKPYAGFDGDNNVNLRDFAIVANDFGKSGSSAYKGNQQANSYTDPVAIDFGTGYYWRIDEVNDGNTWRGDTLSFKAARIIFNCDGDSVLSASGGDLDVWVEKILAPLENSHVTTLSWCDGSGGNAALYDSDVLEPWGFHKGVSHPYVAPWIAGGNDPAVVIVDEARARGFEIWYSFRINDIHDSPDGPNIEAEYPTFKADNPSWMIGTGWPYGYSSALRFDVCDVRNIKFDTIMEMFNKYDFDGIELDWMRSPTCFDPGTEPANAHILTAFMQRVRDALNVRATARGRDIVLAVRVDEDLNGCYLDGLDVNSWIDDDLVDVIILGSGVIDIAVEEFTALTDGTDKTVYPCIYGWPSGYSPVPADMARALATNYWYQGADGIYTFNWFPHSAANAYQISLLSEIGDPAGLIGLDKMYAAERGTPSREYPHNRMNTVLPESMTAPEVINVPLMVGEDIDAAYTPVSIQMRVECEGNLDSGDTFIIKLNDTELTQTRGGQIITMSPPASEVLTGQNTISVNLTVGSATVKAVELHVSY